MKPLIAPVTAALALTLAACGAETPEATVVDVAPAAARTTPAPALAPGTLSRIADVAPGHARIGYVNVSELEGFGGALAADSLRGLVLGGTGAARLGSASAPAPATAVQVGDATVFDGSARRVVGGSPGLRAELASTTPDVNLITDETPSAVESCLGDSAAQVIVGSAVLGRSAAIGVGLFDNADAPAGRKLLICAAPHFFRQLDPTVARLKRTFADADVPAAHRPVIGDTEIGERVIVSAAISYDALPPATVRALLRGGSALTGLLVG